MKNVKFKSTGAVIRATNEEAKLLHQEGLVVYVSKGKQKSYANKQLKKLNNYVFGKLRAGKKQVIVNDAKKQFSFIHIKTQGKTSYPVHAGMRNSYDIKFQEN
jgi:hypothetical protein